MRARIRGWHLLVAVATGLFLSVYGLADDDKQADEQTAEEKVADENAEEDEVEFPKLPKGAGEIDKDAPKKFSQTKSGLKYRVLRKPGEDAPKPKPTNTVKVHYRGWFDSGKDFDSSYKRGEPIEFRLDEVIKGWTEGMQLVGKGGMIELEIPYKLGYGELGLPGIPPKSTLHFLVELLEIH